MNVGEFEDTTLVGNDIIEKAIHEFYQEQTEHRYMGICMAVRNRIAQDGHLLFPVDVGVDDEGAQTFEFKNLELDGKPVMVAFTSIGEKKKDRRQEAYLHSLTVCWKIYFRWMNSQAC